MMMVMLVLIMLVELVMMREMVEAVGIEPTSGERVPRLLRA